MSRSRFPILCCALAALLGNGAAHGADATTVINELMYHPAGSSDPEWIELHNVMSVNMDISGWSLTGGVNYAFPNGTTIPAGGYIVVASNPTALQNATGLTGVHGPWTGALNNAGETVRLRNRTSRIMDEVSYKDQGQWPHAADGSGASLARRDPHAPASAPGSWAASPFNGGTPGGANFAPKLGAAQTVFALGDPWLYQSTSLGLPDNWAVATYSAGSDGWLSGNGIFAFEDAALPAPTGTILPSPAGHPSGTYYFQRQFTVSGDPASAQWNLRTLFDDGALIFLNGNPIHRRNLPSGAISGETRASTETDNAAWVDLPIDSADLLTGINTLSVEVHEAGSPVTLSPGASTGITLNALTLDEIGGSLLAGNYATQEGATAFAKDLIANGAYAPTHTIPNLNNGSYGNPSSWIGNSPNSFCGIRFGSGPVSIARVAWGRDNTGAYAERSAGTYTLEYTTVANPSESTPATGNPATGWATIGTATYSVNGPAFSVRHAYSFPSVMATGIRLQTPPDACIDELEVGPEGTPPVLFTLLTTGGALNPATDLALTGTAFAKDVIPGYPIHAIPHLNDGITGNSNSWIGNSPTSFCGISFATAQNIGRVAFARDNTGTYSDRTVGLYTVQYTTVAGPSASTPDAAWQSVGTIYLDAAIPNPSQRHVFEFAPVNATGIRLLVPNGACIDELELYAPVAPDVVWGASLERRAIIAPPSTIPLRISELSGSAEVTWKVELQNTGTVPLALGGMRLASSDAPTGGYTLPAQTLPPGGFLVLNQTTLGFRPASSAVLLLYSAGGDGLVDSVPVKTIAQARDSEGRMLVPNAATFGGANTFTLTTDIVINEIMYHFPGGPEEWIELTNRGPEAVDLSGWRFDADLQFTFPAGSVLQSGEYLVVANDATALKAKWPEQSSRILGNFIGTLSNRTDRIELLDAVGNPACVLRYQTGGAWPELPDGDGASLELRDSRADFTQGVAWDASTPPDSTWQDVSYTLTSGQTFGQTPLWNEFRFGLLNSGECWIDDVSVVRVSNGQQLIQGGNFESAQDKWRCLGNHGASAIEPEPGNEGNHVLRLRASGPFSWNHNHIETTFLGNTALIDGESYTVSFRARWVSGSHRLNSRAYYSRLARTTELAIPGRIGTPGSFNSRGEFNVGPILSELSHSPAIPAPDQPVSIRVTATDPDNVAAATLHYALNGDTTFTSVPMTPTGDQFAAEIPGQPAGTLVQFYVEAFDSFATASALPPSGPASRALYVVDDGQGTTLAAHEFRVLMLPTDTTTLLTPLNRLSDGRIGGTVIYRRQEVFYDVGVRLQGTAAGRIRDGDPYVGYDVAFPKDQLFRGVHDSVNLDRSGRSPVVRGQDEIYVKHLFHRAGLPSTYDDLIYLIVPTAAHTGTAILQMAGYEKTFLDDQFDGDGTIFNLDGTYEPATTTDGNPESLKNPVPLAPQIQTDFTHLGSDKEQYRGALDPRAGRGPDDFTGLIAFCQTMALPNPQLVAQIGNRMDLDEWLRVAALYSLCGINDCYMTGGFSHNLRIHVPSSGGRVTALPWDMDFVHSLPFNSPAILAGGNLRRIIDNSPAARRAYYGHLQDLCATVFDSTYLTPWMQHYGSVVGQNMVGQIPYVNARRSFVLSQLPASVAFAITTNGGAAFTVPTSTATLEGTGWINVREIRRSDTGAALIVEWLSENTWRATVPLNPGANPLTLQAYDYAGQLIASDDIAITSTAMPPSPRDFLRITEVHYHPAEPTGDELAASTDDDDFEFIELRNIGTAPLDISGCYFDEGIPFTFPLNTTLGAGAHLLVVRNAAAFQARYGAGATIAGSYTPANLANSGETLTLRDATGALIQSFTWFDTWFPGTDGTGYSMAIRDPHAPTAAWNNASQWAMSAGIGGTPGNPQNNQFAWQFEGWRQSNFTAAQLTNSLVSGPLGSATTDGVQNQVRYALGLSALAPAPALLTATAESGALVVRFRRLRGLLDAQCIVEASTDLEHWDALTSPTTTVIDQGDGTELVTVRDTAPISNVPRWLRLRVSLP